MLPTKLEWNVVRTLASLAFIISMIVAIYVMDVGGDQNNQGQDLVDVCMTLYTTDAGYQYCNELYAHYNGG